MRFNSSTLCASALFAAVLVTGACQPPTTTTTSNSNSTTNTNGASTNTNAPTTTTSDAANAGTTIDTREPERYQATYSLTPQTSGGSNVLAMPKLTAEVAKSGADRRIAFKLPGTGEEIIYLDRADKRYLITPARRQYAELTRDAVGFDVPRSMTPGQIIAYLQKQKGYERVGEEQLNGRTVIKYRYANTTQTGTQAGQVNTETFVYVDKETGLPLRSELTSQATGNVQGQSGLRVTVEMQNINTNPDQKIFELPTDYKQVSPEEVRQQMNALTQFAMQIAGNLMGQMNNTGAAQQPNQPSNTQQPTNTQPSPTATPGGQR